jgi:hypothetical protein
MINAIKNLKKRMSLMLFFLGASFFLSIASAHAAPLNFATAELINIASPTTTLTIATSSVADALRVNATSVIVTLSSSSGGAFTIMSPSYDLSVATSSTGGSATTTCSLGVQTIVISQSTNSTVYTITPSGTMCANTTAPILTNVISSNITSSGATITWNSNIAADSTVSYGVSASYGATSTDATLVTSHSIALSGLTANTLYHFLVTSSENSTSTKSGDETFTTAASNSGGGGGSGTIGVSSGGGDYISPVTTPTTSTVSTGSPSVSTSVASSTLIAELNALEAQLARLQAQVNGSTSGSTTTRFSYGFTRNLFYGITGTDVMQLQLFLISQNKGPAARALQTHGVTKNFANLTLAALIEFQKSVGIIPASGYFGPITRAYLSTIAN